MSTIRTSADATPPRQLDRCTSIVTDRCRDGIFDDVRGTSNNDWHVLRAAP